jgi:PAS domain S-box-containing protein
MKPTNINVSSNPAAAQPAGIRGRFSLSRSVVFPFGGILAAGVVAVLLLYGIRGSAFEIKTIWSASLILAALVYLFLFKHLLEKQRTQRTLERSMDLLSQAEQMGNFGSWEWDIAQDRVTWSDGLYRIFGLSPAEFGATFGAYVKRIHPLDQEYVRRAIQVTFYKQGIFEYENRIVRSDGQIRILYTRGKVLLDAQSKPARLQALCMDVTEGRPGQDANRQLSRIVEQTADTVVVTDAEGKIEYVNLAFEQLTGFTKEEVMGHTPRIFKSGNYDDQFHREVWSTILRGESFLGEIEDYKKNGDAFYEVKTITPLRNTQGKITHFVATGKDITKHKLGEEKLKESKQKLNRVDASSISETRNSI